MEHMFTPVVRKMNTNEFHNEMGKSEFATTVKNLEMNPNHFPGSIPTELGNRMDFLLVRNSDNHVVYRQIKSGLDLTIVKEK